MSPDEATPAPLAGLPFTPVHLELFRETPAFAARVAIVTKAGPASGNGFVEHGDDFVAKAGDFAA